MMNKTKLGPRCIEVKTINYKLKHSTNITTKEGHMLELETFDIMHLLESLAVRSVVDDMLKSITFHLHFSHSIIAEEAEPYRGC